MALASFVSRTDRITVSDAGQRRSVSLTTMHSGESGLEQLAAEGDLELLQLVTELRQRQEGGVSINTLTGE